MDRHETPPSETDVDLLRERVAAMRRTGDEIFDAACDVLRETPRYTAAHQRLRAALLRYLGR